VRPRARISAPGACCCATAQARDQTEPARRASRRAVARAPWRQLEPQQQRERQRGQRDAAIDARDDRARQGTRAQCGGQFFRLAQMQVGEPVLARQQLQVGLAQAGEVFAPRRRAETWRIGQRGAIVDHPFAADTAAAALTARIGLRHFVGCPRAQRATCRIELRDRRRRQFTDSDDQPADLARLVVVGGPMARIERRRLLPVAHEHQRWVPGEFLGDDDAAVHGLGHFAAAGPRHAAVDAGEGRPQLGPVGAHLDRREQQIAAVLGEDRPTELRTARQFIQCDAQRVLHVGQPRHRRAIEPLVEDIHALRDVDHHHVLEQRARQVHARLQEGRRQRERGDREDHTAAIGAPLRKMLRQLATKHATVHGSPGE